MGKAMFYHLTRDPVEVTAATLLTRALGAGWRVALRGGDRTRLEWLDAQLWLGAKDSFLPHGLAGGPHDADQPILLTTARDAPNRPACVMAVDRAEVDASEVAALERLWILFDGQDEAALTHARGQWKAMVAAGVQAEYWSQDGGAWAKKAQSGGG
ncbi:DNA polymerase III subunit chi [Roseibaca sp. Y0-43]|uniref:DNA polymerase III subunit chi n=1 Tax=Roseibaca sp. Y0-43 TaxID=2816854 RepID=UPI001D0CD511|nr:DNA polymerase III subunit chi [Roseibaca sp. Y0-43]MCC1481533.1 DNA polymerase III subunit chi [Roseibaca sp. Y0-43]